MGSNGQMDDDLSNTIFNLNQMIDTANTTISSLAGNQSTTTNLKSTYDEKASCITKGKRSCDKDAFDTAFSSYVTTLTCTGPNDSLKKSNDYTCDPVKLFTKIYTQEGELQKEIIKAKLTKEINTLNDLLGVANEQMKYYNHLDDLADKYAEATETLGTKVDKTISRLKTEHRRTFYENQQADLMSHVTKILTFVYWFSVFAWVIVLLYRTKYADYTNAGLTLAFIAFPFVADILIVWTFQIVIAIYDMLPTDAYLDMRR
jgi:hypothetical protein